MGPISGVVVYLLTWWIVFMCALPFKEDPQIDRVPGTLKSAPEKPYIKEKFLISCGVAALVWCVIWYLIHIRIIDFREMAAQMPLL